MSPRLAAVIFLMGVTSCSRGESNGPAIKGVDYDKKTGRLSRISADFNHNGKIDSWTYMEGTRPLRTEQDRDEDGKIDRWEYNTPDGRIEHVELSTKGTGTPDTWVYPDATGQPARIEMAVRDGKHIDRWETYTGGKLTKVAEDTNGDGRPDKWETHDGPAVLISADFDRNFDGVPDEHLRFDKNGRVQK
jgi:hypothetical protein